MKIIGIFLLICKFCTCLDNDLPVETQASTVANFIVHPEIPLNDKSIKPMFEFMPHFDKSSYDFMIPEGKNNQESVAAVVQFYGILSKPTPQFQLVGDDNEWFKIGDVETIKEPNYMITSIPILTREGADVLYQEANKGIYAFKITASHGDYIAESHINVEVLSFGPMIKEEKEKPMGIENIEAKSLEPVVPLSEEAKSPVLIDNEATQSSISGTAEPLVTEPLDFTIESELSSITEISLDELEKKLQNEAVQFTPTMPVELENAESITSQIESSESTSSLPEGTVSPVSVDNVERFSSENSSNDATEPLINEPSDFTIESELSSITDISIDELEQRLQNETVQFTTPIPVKEVTPTSASKIPETPIDFEPIAPIPSEIEMPPILLQFVDINTQLPAGEAAVTGNIQNGFILTNFEIRAICNESVSKELLEISVEPSDIFDVRPHFVLTRMPSQIVIKDASQFSNGKIYPVKVKVEYADISSPTYAELTVNVKVENSMKNTATFEKSKYNFSIPENSVTGAFVGELHANNSDDQSPLIYSLIGKNSDLFSISDGVITLLCPDSKICLDYEKQTSYYLVAMATTLVGMSSDPITVVINVADVNDNSPTLVFPEKTVKIQDARILEPFLIKINDKDSDDVNNNTISFEGSAAKFLTPELVSANVYRIQVSGIPEIGGYMLNIHAKDEGNKKLKTDQKSLKIEVLNTAGKSGFSRPRYERKIAADKLHKGNPLVQLQFTGEAVENIQFIFLDGNPGWLSIEDFGGNVFVGDVPKNGVAPGEYIVTVAVLKRQVQQIIDRCQIIINIEGTQMSMSVFNEKVFAITVPKAVEKNVVILPLNENEKRGMALISDSIYAWGDSMEAVHVPSDIIQIESNTITVSALVLQNLRGLQFQIVAIDNPNDRALVTIYLLSESGKYAEEKMRRSKPKFASPWTSEDLAIPVSIPEETPLEHSVIHLPAFNPETGDLLDNITLKGAMAEYFTYDTSRGSLVVSKLIDYEALDPSEKTFDLEIVADNQFSPTSANLIVTVQNLDDNAPQIRIIEENKNLETPLKLKLSENSPPGKNLMDFEIYDADAEPEKRKYDRFNFKLIGETAGNFQIQQKEKSYILATSPAVNLDRENEKQSILLLEVRDPAGNVDTLPIIIEVNDENDNRPMIEIFNKHLEVVENWPIGTLLTKVVATDKDESNKEFVHFSLTGPASKFLEIDSESGEIKTNSSLHGLTTFESYRFQVIASDGGNPEFTSASDFDVRIIETSSLQEGEEHGVKFTSPAIDFTLNVSEDTLPNTRILTAEAAYLSESVDRTVRYSLEPISPADDGWLSINPNNGDIFVQSGFDYEKQSFVTDNKKYLICLDAHLFARRKKSATFQSEHKENP